MSYLNKNSIKSKTRWWVPKQMRPKTRRRRSKLKELRGTTGASPYLSLTTRTQTGQRLDHHSKQFKWEIVSMFWHFTELIWSPAVFPWKENPHRLGSSGGAGWVQGTDGNTISLLCKISFHNFRHNFSFWNVETSAKVTASSESGVTVCLPATRGGKMRWSFSLSLLFQPFPFSKVDSFSAFKPDFLLVRQNLKDAGEDNRFDEHHSSSDSAKPGHCCDWKIKIFVWN